MPKNIQLVLNMAFVDAKGVKVTMVRQFSEGEPDYVQGFRFRGDNGTNYREDGGVVGWVGRARLIQFGAVPLRAAYGEPVPPLELEVGKFYRNGLGQIVMIVATVMENDRFYQKGFRFADHRNTYYTPAGSVESRIWGKLDLVDVIPEDETIPLSVMKKIEASIVRCTKTIHLQRTLFERYRSVRSFFFGEKPQTV